MTRKDIEKMIQNLNKDILSLQQADRLSVFRPGSESSQLLDLRLKLKQQLKRFSG